MNPLESTERWKPLDAPVRNLPGGRAAEQLRAVVAQFNPAANPRYTPGGPGVTWCNIFAWDVSRALGCEIPHWVGESGQPVAAGKGRELNVNATLDWLGGAGRAQGWFEVVELTAAERARCGYPTVVLWKNPKGGHGHIAVLLPPRGNEVRIAQAGRECLFDAPLREGFHGAQPLRFFSHD